MRRRCPFPSIVTTLSYSGGNLPGKFFALEKVPGISAKVAAEIKNPDLLKRAEAEIEFAFKNELMVRFLYDEEYPYRLKECQDAPLILYTKGNMDLNASRIISIVGNTTGDFLWCRFDNKLLTELSEMFSRASYR